MAGVSLFAVWASCCAGLAGSADYVAARASHRVPSLTVTAWGQLIGLVPLVLVAPFYEFSLDASEVAWASASGLCIAVGIAALYRALGIGPIAVLAPLAAVVGVAVPATLTLLGGVQLTARDTAGLIAGGCAIALMSGVGPGSNASHQSTENRLLGLGLALAGGAGIGMFSFTLYRASVAAGPWPLLLSRGTAALLLMSTLYLNPSSNDRTPGGALGMIALAGLLDSVANLFYLAAIREGALPVVATIAAFYPAITVLLALLLDRERLSARQVIGLLAAGLSIGLISTARIP